MPSIYCLDVDYRDQSVVTACLGFERWEAPVAASQYTRISAGAPAPYEPGFFYRRELPYLLAALAEIAVIPEIIVIDGYVWLGPGRPGLGAHLFDAIGKTTAVIGVAKKAFHAATGAHLLIRGKSAQPLFITAEGIELAEAANGIRSMHDQFRIPTLLKQVDQLCRRS